MEHIQGSITPITLDDRLHAYENQWVALDAHHAVIASAEHLADLIEQLSAEQQTQQPTFLQVLPHNLSFISGAAV